MLTLWIVVIVLGVLQLFEIGLLLFLLQGLGKMKQAGALFSAKQESSPFTDRGLAIGTQAPEFVVIDHGGRSISLKDFDGNWRILAFVSPGCPACAMTIKTLDETLQERPDIAILVVGSAARAANTAYAIEQNVSLPILTPDATLAQEVYLVQGIPFVYILDEVGIIRAKGVVNIPEHLQQLLVSANLPKSLLRSR
ncbi:MAG TPA: redoxin domain-containing protein [Ktedonobacteraceae bacterium]|nr:redoxin domain-containing protein [Ktedonobacteraceae bacterium]